MTLKMTENDKKRKVPRGVYFAFAAEVSAAVVLTATFNTFHVETFLNEYKLDLAAYASGHVIYAIVNTLNDLLGAYFVDAWAPIKGRAWLLSFGGAVWTVMFLLPWFPWKSYPAFHFVFSLSCYDTLYSFCAIAGGSLLTEMNISDSQRIQILRVKSIVGMTVAFVTTQLGQYFFASKGTFRIYCVVLAMIALGFYGLFYYLLTHEKTHKLMPRPMKTTSTPQTSTPLMTTVKQILSDFYHLKNFRYWLGMEMCLETQCNFNRHYLRIFLVHFSAGMWSLTTLASIISGLPLAMQIIRFGMYSVMDHIGVYHLYQYSFFAKLVASSMTACYVYGTSTSTGPILVFFFIFNMIVTELPTGGFPIAMGNMHKELSLRRLQTGRGIITSSSGMFMGLNAVFCKPMDSLLPILAATQLDAAHFQQNKNSSMVQSAMLHLLLLPPFLFSIVQLYSWYHYTLDTEKLATIENALQDTQQDPSALKQLV
ncbi:hypothetical protein THRCLA_05558 [Thraustotheca clavata]|uniref:Transmembrane protein n=1 Tax=Thraustotheca clavata TaxID=74557 RepID=A0A1V9ZVK7_9STRA|nr:hypothetical protein THRCLA_05558 [Thraustotheca clavata]